jgi:hypothetical protein
MACHRIRLGSYVYFTKERVRQGELILRHDEASSRGTREAARGARAVLPEVLLEDKVGAQQARIAGITSLPVMDRRGKGHSPPGAVPPRIGIRLLHNKDISIRAPHPETGMVL